MFEENDQEMGRPETASHGMMVKNTYPTGAQEFYCPTCGRHFIMQWPPEYKQIVLNEGDVQANHSGSTGGVMMGSADIEAGEVRPDDQTPHSGFADGEDDDYLAPWQDWLDGRDL
jgi:hypothetical protein